MTDENDILFEENRELVEYLKKSRLFGHMSPDFLHKLEPVSELIRYPAETEILTEGEPNDRVFFLVDGEVEVIARGERILVLKRKGDIFGEMSVISAKPCSATIVSLTPVTVFSIAARTIGTYSAIRPDDLHNFFYRIFAMILTEKLTLTTAKARQYESTNRLLEETKASLEQKIAEQLAAEKNRLQLEAQLRHSQKLEAIGTLAGGIAHDFNNLLFAMLGYLTMARDDLAVDHPVRHDLEEALIAANRARELVQQILTFSRHQEGERKPVQIAPLIKETIRFIRSSLPSTIEIEERIDTDHGFVLGDPSQIHQVIMNLCTNAGHAMRDNGGLLAITLDTQRVDAQFADRHKIVVGDYLVLSVTDTGCGMTPAIIERIFDPFFTTKPVGEGTGMGLAVVHGIIKNYQGAITVDSEPGCGTVFRVYLPVVGSRNSPDKSVSQTLPMGSEHILVVDDEAAIAHLIRRILEKCGYRVTVTQSSLQALQLFRQTPEAFDLVITDQTMPKMTGTRLATAISRYRPVVKVIITTGYDNVPPPIEESGSVMIEYLGKPVTADRLTGTVRHLLDRRVVVLPDPDPVA
jgi:signal transduction histidine kinase/CheY-like chemotaxis protein